MSALHASDGSGSTGKVGEEDLIFLIEVFRGHPCSAVRAKLRLPRHLFRLRLAQVMLLSLR